MCRVAASAAPARRLGLDRLGHLCLDLEEGDEAWAAFLGGVDLAFVTHQRKHVQVRVHALCPSARMNHGHEQRLGHCLHSALPRPGQGANTWTRVLTHVAGSLPWWW